MRVLRSYLEVVTVAILAYVFDTEVLHDEVPQFRYRISSPCRHRHADMSFMRLLFGAHVAAPH